MKIKKKKKLTNTTTKSLDFQGERVEGQKQNLGVKIRGLLGTK